MASPWTPPQRHPVERPWLGMAMLAALPLLSLILIRMLWSGSSLWFLTVGIILLGAAAVVFLARRPQEHEYSRQTLSQEPNRIPLILMALGVVFLAMLLLPNFSSSDSGSNRTTQLSQQSQSTGATTFESEVSGVSQPPAGQAPQQQAPAQQESVLPPIDSSAESGETYIVVSGDTLWDIALRFEVTVEAIVEANELENAAELQLGQELIIPPPGEKPVAEESTGVPPVEEAQPIEAVP